MRGCHARREADKGVHVQVRHAAVLVFGVPLVAGALLPAGAVAATGATVAPSGAIASIASRCSGARDVPSRASARRVRAAVLCMANRFRRVHGRRALRPNPKLTRAAQSYTVQMASGRFFSHTSPGGGTMVDRLRSTGYIASGGTWTVGENLGWGTSHMAAPAVIFDAWMRSPGHRANLLRPTYREAGVGVAEPAPSGSEGATYAIEFGTRAAR